MTSGLSRLSGKALLSRFGSQDVPIVLRTPLSLHDISRNLQKRANDWRDSNIPEELRKIGVDKLVLEGETNELSLEWGGRTNPVNNPALFLTITRLPDGASEVTVRFGRGSLRVFALLLLLTSPLQVLLDDDGPRRWYFAAVSAAISLALLITGKSKTPLLEASLLEVVRRATRQKRAENLVSLEEARLSTPSRYSHPPGSR